MSKNEVDRFKKLLDDWSEGKKNARDNLLAFLSMYRQPIIAALRIAER